MTLDDTQVHNEMHIEKWWWRTQNDMSEGARTVLVLIATEKTLTQHNAIRSCHCGPFV